MEEEIRGNILEKISLALTRDTVLAASVQSSGSSVKGNTSKPGTTTPSSSALPLESRNLDYATDYFASSIAIANLVAKLFTKNIIAKVL